MCASSCVIIHFIYNSTTINLLIQHSVWLLMQSRLSHLKWLLVSGCVCIFSFGFYYCLLSAFTTWQFNNNSCCIVCLSFLNYINQLEMDPNYFAPSLCHYCMLQYGLVPIWVLPLRNSFAYFIVFMQKNIYKICIYTYSVYTTCIDSWNFPLSLTLHRSVQQTDLVSTVFLFSIREKTKICFLTRS